MFGVHVYTCHLHNVLDSEICRNRECSAGTCRYEDEHEHEHVHVYVSRGRLTWTWTWTWAYVGVDVDMDVDVFAASNRVSAWLKRHERGRAGALRL